MLVANQNYIIFHYMRVKCIQKSLSWNKKLLINVFIGKTTQMRSTSDHSNIPLLFYYRLVSTCGPGHLLTIMTSNVIDPLGILSHYGCFLGFLHRIFSPPSHSIGEGVVVVLCGMNLPSVFLPVFLSVRRAFME